MISKEQLKQLLVDNNYPIDEINSFLEKKLSTLYNSGSFENINRILIFI